MQEVRALLIFVVYAIVAGCIFFAAVKGFYEPKDVVGLGADSILLGMILGPFASLVWALNVPLSSDNTGLQLFGVFSFVTLPILVLGFCRLPLRPLRVAVAIAVWLGTGLIAYGMAHLVD